jgi:hypothetical protein
MKIKPPLSVEAEQTKHQRRRRIEQERISDIRTSERRFYQKITDIYALAAD